MSNVSCIIDGKKYDKFLSVSVSRSMQSLEGSFQFASINPNILNDGWSIVPESTVELYLNHSMVISGYIDSVSPTISDTDDSLAVSGRDNMAGLIDCSAYLPGNQIQWKNAKLETILSDLCKPFGVKVVATVNTGDPISLFCLDRKEEVLDAIRRLCNYRSVLPVPTEDGTLAISKIGTIRSADTIELGRNAFTAQGVSDYKDRYSHYICRSTNTGSTGWEDYKIDQEEISLDPVIKRYRPKIVQLEEQLSKKDLKIYAGWISQNTASKSDQVTVSMKNWHDAAGVLWQINTIVPVIIPQLKISRDMLIDKIVYGYSGAGTITTVSLIHPNAYDPMPVKTLNKSKKEVFDFDLSDFEGGEND